MGKGKDYAVGYSSLTLTRGKKERKKLGREGPGKNLGESLVL